MDTGQYGVGKEIAHRILYLKEARGFLLTAESDPNLTRCPLTREEMDDATFNAIMQRGRDEAKDEKGRPASEVIANLREGI